MKILLAQSGGIGNQLFQYANALFFAQQLGVDFEILEEPEISRIRHGFPLQLGHFGIRAPIRAMSRWDRLMFSRVKRNQLLARPARALSRNQVLFQHHFLNYSFPATLRVSPQTRTLYLFGYLQTHRIPDAIEPELREHLAFRDAPTGRNLALLQQIQDAATPVSLHVRRGDYTRVHGGKDALPLTYQRNAIEAIRQRVADPTFFVFSDDMPYCKKHLPSHVKMVFVDHNTTSNCHEDLRLMAACQHNIIANSSFSWWGAWLNPNSSKIVCAPSVWRNESISTHILPPQWIRCSVRSDQSRVRHDLHPDSQPALRSEFRPERIHVPLAGEPVAAFSA